MPTNGVAWKTGFVRSLAVLSSRTKSRRLGKLALKERKEKLSPSMQEPLARTVMPVARAPTAAARRNGAAV